MRKKQMQRQKKDGAEGGDAKEGDGKDGEAKKE